MSLKDSHVDRATAVGERRFHALPTLALTGLWILIPFLIVIPAGPTMPAPHLVGGKVVGLMIFSLEGLAIALAVYRRDLPLLSSALMLVLISVITLGFAAAQKLDSLTWAWTFYVLAPLAFGATSVSFARIGSSTRQWLRFGSLDRNAYKRIGLVVALMYAIMLSGITLLRSDMTHQPFMRSGLPLIALVFIGIAIAAVNAGAEEFVYRGLIMHSLDEGIGAGSTSLMLQAVAFGTFHFNSTEPGLTGVAGAALFGLMLGWLRRSARGMLAPYIAHISVDLLIWTVGLVQISLASSLLGYVMRLGS